LVIGFCLLVTGGLGYFKYAQIQAAIAYGESFPEPSETVEVVTVKQVSWQKKLVTTASLVASQSLELRTEVAGRVKAIGFLPGGEVKAGQVLLSLDDSVEQAQLAGAEASLKLQKLKLQRRKMLTEKKLNAADDLDVAEANYSTSLAQVKALKAQINKMTLTAPFDAVSGLFTLQVGEYLDAGTVISRLVGVKDSIWLDFNLPQEQATLKLGDSVMVTDPYDHQLSYQATIIAADAWINPASRNRLYRAELTNPPESFVPGTYINVYLTPNATQEVVSVPSNAVRYSELGASVFVLFTDEEGKQRAKTRRVSIGERMQNDSIITRGLKAGERVAANGAFKLRDGILVNAVEIDSPADKSIDEKELMP
jgi:membrane fusion protein (multidrug efflux system)